MAILADNYALITGGFSRKRMMRLLPGRALTTGWIGGDKFHGLAANDSALSAPSELCRRIPSDLSLAPFRCPVLSDSRNQPICRKANGWPKERARTVKRHVTGTSAISQVNTQNHRVVSRDEWVAQRKELLAREKELTRLGDQIARERRGLPWVRLDKTYTFDTPAGQRTLADLFDGRRQLLVQHFMLAPGWEQGCKNCSYMADHTDSAIVHLAQRDVTFVAVSRARLSEIEHFRQRMGWQFPWVSSYGNHFNRDFLVSFTADEIAIGKADYNFGGRPRARKCPASASSGRMTRAKSSIPTRPTAEAWR
jgi:predicted dithiol-disulfide oxidoreductase (DUF899 family)